jgi:hypothetical protein
VTWDVVLGVMIRVNKLRLEIHPAVVGIVACVSLLFCLAAAAEPAPSSQRSTPTTAATTKPKPKPDPYREKLKAEQPWAWMDYGPFISATINAKWPEGNFAYKGIAIQLGDVESPAAVCFDTDLLRYSAGWTGGFLNLTGVAFDGQHGPCPTPKGQLRFATRQIPGVSPDGKFDDPRPYKPYGPLPRAAGHYEGLYKNGDRVVLAYTVGECRVMEMPEYRSLTGEGGGAFVRTIEVGPAKQPIYILAADHAPAHAPSTQPSTRPTTQPSHVSVRGAGTDLVALEEHDDATYLVVQPHAHATRVELTIAPEGVVVSPNEQPIVDLSRLIHGGPAQWTTPVETAGTVGTGDGPYVVDTIAVPEKNPWNSWMRFGGFDFFSDGRAAVCNWSGDVWMVSGIDAKLDHVKWKRYASGMYQTLGLRIVNDTVYVLGRDQITRLHDLNNDGEADFYEDFNNDVIVSGGFHEFAFDLQTDPQGNFYFSKAGQVKPGGRGWQGVTPHNGCVFKISPDGKNFEVFATGLRAPNGMSAGPHGEITVSDNQGTWTPVCRLNLVHQGDFLGVPDLSHTEPPPTNYGDPVCWFPYPDVDNSSGGGVWLTTDKWGPFKDRMLHLSYGTCSVFLVMMEELPGATGSPIVQGGVVKFPNLSFDTGICRARINPIDGQVYVAGLKGWQTSANKDAGLQRIRYTGKPVDMPNELHVKKDAITIGFTQAVDPQTAGDPDSYSIEQWNYVWSKEYGSPEVHVDDDTAKGRDTVQVKSVDVAADHRSVTLHIPELRPVMQMQIQMKLDAANGAPVEYTIYNTINRVPGYVSRPKPASRPTTMASPKTAPAPGAVAAAPATQAAVK